MNKSKLRDAKRLLKSKVYVLVTEDETTLHGEFPNDFTKAMKLSAMTSARDSLSNLIKVEKKNLKK